MISKVVADIHFLDGSIFFVQFNENILKEFIKMPLILFVRDLSTIAFGRILRIYVKILYQHRLGEGGLVMDTTATVAMPTGSNFEVK